VTHLPGPGQEPDEAPDKQSLDERYGRASRHGRSGLILIAVVAVALGGWAVWAAVGQSHDAITAIVQSFRVPSDHQMSVTVQITRGSSSRVHCVVSALASDHSTVGESVVAVPPGRSGTTTLTVSVKTERRAVAADVGRCR
jgi:hypothetical protein